MIASKTQLLLLSMVVSSVAFADDICPDTKDKKRAEAMFAQAQQREQAGDARAAWAALSKVESDCLVDETPVHALSIRLRKKLGGEEEKAGHLKEAFDWFAVTELATDADRVMMERFQAQPDNRAVFDTVFDHFHLHRRAAEQLKTLRAHALKKAKQLLEDEDKQFASDRESLRQIESAKDWLAYVEGAEKNSAAERAEKRGDTLAAETTRHFLRLAVSYYDFADKPAKTKTIRDKAKKLGDGAKQHGENEAAAEYYQIAGLNKESVELQKRTEAQHKQDEGNRQKQFKKDQDNLEKELGM